MQKTLNYRVLIDKNKGQNCNKIEVLGSIEGEIDKIRSQGPIYKRRQTIGAKFRKTGGEIEEFESLMIN